VKWLGLEKEDGSGGPNHNKMAYADEQHSSIMCKETSYDYP